MKVKLKTYKNMKFRDSDFEFIEQGPGSIGGFKMIEKIGRTCYNSGYKTTDDSYINFVDRMIKSEHYAMLEFYTVYLKFPSDIDFSEAYSFYDKNPYSKFNIVGDTLYVTTNYRVIVENERYDDMCFECNQEENNPKRTTIRFFLSRGISHEAVRHRVASFAQSSQRYICYSKEKFGGEIEFIIPEKIYNLKDLYPETKNLHGEELVLKLKDLDKGVKVWYNHMVETEKEYKFLTLDCGWAAQDARDILPNATSTILNVCMFNEDWKHFFDLRALGTTGKPHPDMKRIAMKVYENF